MAPSNEFSVILAVQYHSPWLEDTFDPALTES